MPGVLLILTVAALTAGAANGQEGKALLQRYECYTCHADNETKTGPAFVDVAATFRRDPKAVTTLSAVVRKGAHGSGLWPMPPMPQVPDADARKIVDYILALKP